MDGFGEFRKRPEMEYQVTYSFANMQTGSDPVSARLELVGAGAFYPAVLKLKRNYFVCENRLP